MRLKFITPEGKHPQTLIYVGKQYAGLNLTQPSEPTVDQKVGAQREKIETTPLHPSDSIRQSHSFQISQGNEQSAGAGKAN